MSSFIRGWYLIYTRPNQEKKVVAQLNEHGVEFILPTVNVIRQWSDRKKYVERPLFPSYVFVHLKSMQEYYTGLDVDGSLYYVKSCGKIARVSDDVINNIQLITESKKHDIEVSSEHFLPGRKILITDGLLTGFCGEVIHHNGKKRILVRVNLLKRNILVTLPSESVVIAPRHLMDAPDQKELVTNHL